MAIITRRDIQGVVGKYFGSHSSYDIDSKEGYERKKSYYYDLPELVDVAMFDSIRKQIDDNKAASNQGASKDSVILSFMTGGDWKDDFAVEVTQLSKTGFSNYVEVAINEVEAIDILNRINPKTKRHVARVNSSKTLLSFAVDLDTGRFIYKRKGKWEYGGGPRPLRFSEYVDELMRKHDVIRKILVELLRLFSSLCPFYNDIAASIDTYGFLGYDITMDELMKYHNSDQFFRETIGRKDMPLNFNKLLFYDGIMAMMMLKHIPEKEHAFFAQLFRDPEVRLEFSRRNQNQYNFDAFHRYYQALYHFSPVDGLNDRLNDKALFLTERFLMSYYVTKGILKDGDEMTLRDLMLMRRHLQADDVCLFRCTSRAGIVRIHDELTRKDYWERRSNFDPNRVIAVRDGKYSRLREILPDEFEWITTAGRIVQEGKDQHNCVGSYTCKTLRDECAIYHWENKGRKYTIEFVRTDHADSPWKYGIRQMYRECNREALREDKAIVMQYLYSEKAREIV